MKPLRIFIVDDDTDLAQGLAILMQIEGHSVEIAHSGEEAIRKFAREEFDITFLDVRLPGMDGGKCLEEMRVIRPEAKVIMMTAYSVQKTLDRALYAGAYGVLHKPLNTDDLLALLETIAQGVVLIVEDGTDVVDCMVEVLSAKNYTVLVARTGREALDRILGNGFDILILDLSLPILNGLEIHRRLVQRRRTLPTVIVSGHQGGIDDRPNRAWLRLLTDPVARPLEPAILLQAIEDLMDRSARP